MIKGVPTIRDLRPFGELVLHHVEVWLSVQELAQIINIEVSFYSFFFQGFLYSLHAGVSNFYKFYNSDKGIKQVC
jgi:hypothetical protein